MGIGKDQKSSLGIINDGVYSCSAESGSLDLTLLRSPVFSHHEVHHPRPDIHHRYVDQGESDFAVQLRPSEAAEGYDSFTRYALEYNQPSVNVIESVHEGSFPLEKSFCSVKEGTSVLISTIKRAEDDKGWIVRAVEAAGKKASASFDFTWLGISGDFNFSPFEIKTIRIGDDKALSEVNLTEM